jgi:hypothetical protein
MKKLLVTILAFVYLSTSMGATMHLHYCMGKLASWGLIDKEGKNCATCGMAKKTSNPGCVTAKTGCCKDEHKLIKTDKDQKVPQSDLQFSKIFAEALAAHNPALLVSPFSSLAVAFPNSNAPPLTSKNPIFLLNRNFRI